MGGMCQTKTLFLVAVTESVQQHGRECLGWQSLMSPGQWLGPGSVGGGS